MLVSVGPIGRMCRMGRVLTVGTAEARPQRARQCLQEHCHVCIYVRIELRAECSDTAHRHDNQKVCAEFYVTLLVDSC